MFRAGFAVLTEREFALFFTGYLTSFVGSQLTPVAVTFALLDRGGTAGQVGAVLAAEAGPLVAFLLVGGVVADRLPRRRVMIGADLLRFGSQGTLALLLLAGRPPVWVFMVLLALTGAGDAFFGPAMTGLIPQVASAARLQQANALNGLAQSSGSVIGPALGGLVVAVANPGWAVAVDALTYVASAICLSRIRIPLRGSIAGASFLAELVTGWREFRRRTWLWVVVLQFAFWHMLVYAPFMVLGAVVAKADLGGAGAWGGILAALGAGSLAGGLVMLHVRPRRPLLVASLSMFTHAPPLVLLALRAPVGSIVAGAFVTGAGLAVFGTLWDTTVQREVPPEVLSRVSAYDYFGSVAFLPVGYAVVGPLAALFGVSGTLWFAAAWLLVTSVLVVAVPAVTGLVAPVEPARPAARPAT